MNERSSGSRYLFFSSSLWTTLQVGTEVCISPGSRPLQPVSECGVLCSPVPAARHLLALLFAPLVRMIWAQGEN